MKDMTEVPEDSIGLALVETPEDGLIVVIKVGEAVRTMSVEQAINLFDTLGDLLEKAGVFEGEPEAADGLALMDAGATCH